MLLLACGLVVLLAALAALQYNWLGQLSAAARERMQRTLRAGADRFAEEFDAEMARVYFGIQTDVDVWRRRDGEAFARRLDAWRASARHAGLVREVFVLERAERGASLARFDPAARSFVPAGWPAEFAGLRARLEAAAPPGAEGAQGRPVPLPNVEPDVPAVVSPVVSSAHAGASAVRGEDEVRRRLLTNLSPVSAYVVAVLDPEVISRELLSKLDGRYFAGEGERDYRVTVVSRGEGRRVFYQSEPGANAGASSEPDARADIFRIRPEAMGQLLPPHATRGESGAAGPAVVRSVEVESADAEAGAAGHGAKRVRVLRPGEREASAQVVFTPGGGAGWELLVAHRAGSLDAAVAAARGRNLLLGSAVLLLLAASAALIVVSALRAQRLARRQFDFVAGVSHELRTPLAVICSAGENLADGVIKDTEQVCRYGDLIRGEGRRLTEMVEQALEFAGAQRGRARLKLAPVSVAEVVADALGTFRAADEDGRVTFETDIPDDLPPALADVDALRRSLQNLVGNAVKYGGEGDWVGVRARLESGPRGDVEVWIEVEDRGPGIAPPDLPHIFEPFYRGRGALAAQIHGSGLGLSLTRAVIEAHPGGRVSVQSRRGRGSVFTIHLLATGPDVCGGDEHVYGELTRP